MTNIFLFLIFSLTILYCKKEKSPEKDITTVNNNLNNNLNAVTVQGSPSTCAKTLDIIINDSIYNFYESLAQSNSNCYQHMKIIENSPNFHNKEHPVVITNDELHIFITGCSGSKYDMIWDGKMNEFDSVLYVTFYLRETIISPIACAEAVLQCGTYCFNLLPLKTTMPQKNKIRIKLSDQCGKFTKQLLYE